MFILECRGANESFSKNSSSMLLDENWINLCSDSTDSTDDYSTVELFQFSYHKGSTLCNHSEDLFGFARKYFQFLNRAARNDNVSNVNNLYSNYPLLRGSLVDFFFHIQAILKNDRIEGKSDSTFTRLFDSFRLTMGPMDSIPDYIIQNCTSDDGNLCSLASFHMFHAYLELFWLHFIIVLKVALLNPEIPEQLLDIETEPIVSDDVHNYNDSGHIKEIENEIEWFLYNLTSLTNKSLEKSKFKNIFSCCCVKEVWLVLLTVIEKLAVENKCAQFWHYFNNVIKKYVLRTNLNEITDDHPCNFLYKMTAINSTKPIEFSLYLLLKIARIQHNNANNKTNISQKVHPNFELLEFIVKCITQSDRAIPEDELRTIMKQIIQLMNIWSEPRNEVVTLLWEYFHKRLNCAFAISVKDDASNLLKSFSISDAVSDLKASNASENFSLHNLKTENSFYLFNALLSMHLKKCISNNLHSLCQKIKGRILPKFTLNKIVALNEYGLKHFSSIFLAMGLATNIKDICDKLQELLLQLPFNDLHWNKKHIVMKTHLIILWLYVDNKISIKNSALPVKHLVMSHGNTRDSESMHFIKITIDGCLDILDASPDYQNDEYVLIDSWMSKYLSVCNVNDMHNILETFSSLVSKLKILCSYQIDLSDSVLSMVDAVYEHIFVCAKSLYFNGCSAIQIANLIYNFGEFSLDNNFVAQKYGTFDNLIKCFLDSKDANERVVKHLMTLFLQDDHVMQSLENENKACQSLIINSWVKCSLASKDNSLDDDTHLILLINQLGEFSSLNFTPSHEDDNQRNLCNFFFALRSSWNNINDFSERMEFKKRVNIYLKGIDKYVVNNIKNPKSLDNVMQVFIIVGALFLHCSQIIYTRSDPTCLLHLFISTVLLPPQLFMEKKLHHYITAAVCKSWYTIMKGLHQLDHRNDPYVGKAMKDMIVQYLPFFSEKTLLNKDKPFNVMYRMIPEKCSGDLLLEKYILDSIASNFVTCRGKQSHVHSTKALCILLHLCNCSNLDLLFIITASTLLAVFEQLMFSDLMNPNKKIALQILNALSNTNDCKNDTKAIEIRNEIRDILIKTCQKHLAFNSTTFFKLVQQVIPLLESQNCQIFLSSLKMEIVKVEKMRGVGFDQGLRNGLKEIETQISKI